MPLLVTIHDVVVEQREVVDQLHRDRTVHRRLRRASDGAGGGERERRANRLPAAGAVVVPAEVVDGDRPEVGLERVHGRAQRGPDEVARAVEPLGKGRRHAATSSVGACRPAASRAAATPLRTALSMVAGQPVSVQAPATYRPSICVFGPGRSAAVPGPCLKVARCSRVTKNSSTLADAASGKSCSSAGTNWARNSSTFCVMYSRAQESETARYWPCSRPVPRVRSKTHWTGVSCPAANGRSVT